MIQKSTLFKDDAEPHHIDTGTTNKSFITVSELLKKEGVENYDFMLKVINPDLLTGDIDPWSTDLTLGQEAAIVKECSSNPWYYFREVLRVTTNTGGWVSFKANVSNIASFWCVFNNLDILVTQIRQTGKTASIRELKKYLQTLVYQNTTIDTVVKHELLAHVERAEMPGCGIPGYLDIGISTNIHNVWSSTVGPASTCNLARGIQGVLLHIDDAVYISNLGLLLSTAYIARINSTMQALSQQVPISIILTTNSTCTKSPTRGFVKGLIENGVEWENSFYDFPNSLKALTDKLSNTGFVILTAGHRQLGYSDEWLKNAIDEFPDSPTVDSEFFNSWACRDTEGGIPSDLKDTELSELWLEVNTP